MRLRPLVTCLWMIPFFCGCALEEVRSKHKLGNEWRHSGSQNSNDERYSIEEGVEFRWAKGWTTGLTYRRRDVNDGNGDNDNGFWVDFSFPLWKAPKKPDALAERVEELERRLAAIESADQPGGS